MSTYMLHVLKLFVVSHLIPNDKIVRLQRHCLASSVTRTLLRYFRFSWNAI